VLGAGGGIGLTGQVRRIKTQCLGERRKQATPVDPVPPGFQVFKT